MANDDDVIPIIGLQPGDPIPRGSIIEERTTVKVARDALGRLPSAARLGSALALAGYGYVEDAGRGPWGSGPAEIRYRPDRSTWRWVEGGALGGEVEFVLRFEVLLDDLGLLSPCRSDTRTHGGAQVKPGRAVGAEGCGAHPDTRGQA